MEREIDYPRPTANRVVVIGDPPTGSLTPGRCLSYRDASLT